MDGWMDASICLLEHKQGLIFRFVYCQIQLPIRQPRRIPSTNCKSPSDTLSISQFKDPFVMYSLALHCTLLLVLSVSYYYLRLHLLYYHYLQLHLFCNAQTITNHGPRI